MERRPEPSDSSRSETIVDARTSLALWLRAGRAHRGMSLDDVARVTKIQPRILERLEAGKLDGLPAEVFVRGFVRSFARCVGLDEREALRRYAACALSTQDLTPTVRALVEAMADLAPGSASSARATPRKMEAVEVIDLAAPVLLTAPAVAPARAIRYAPTEPEAVTSEAAGSFAAAAERPPSAAELTAPIATAIESSDSPESPESPESVDLAEPAANEPGPAQAAQPFPPSQSSSSPSSKKKRHRRRKGRAQVAEARDADAAGLPRQELAVGTPATASPVVAPSAAEPTAADAVAPAAPAPAPPASAGAAESVEPSTPWQPTMPPLASPGVPWRRSGHRLPAVAGAGAVAAAQGTQAPQTRPSLVIDDADPDSAERVLEERAETLAPRRTFLPPILLDREDRFARQGGLTLAVILLLIAATLTLSYLMRRPSASGDGMTGREAPAELSRHAQQG